MSTSNSTSRSSKGQFGNAPSFYCSILNDICQEEQAEITWLSNNYLGIIEKNGHIGRVMGHRFDLNSAVAELAADDKFATFDVLNAAGIPIIEHVLLYEFTNQDAFAQGRNSLGYVCDYLHSHDDHIVIKPNNGSLGLGVSQITTEAEIIPALEKIFHQAPSASMCPFYKIRHEYRTIVLDGEARLIYRKDRGDDWRFNLCAGAKATKIDDATLEKKLSILTIKATETIGLRFCSVDIIETVGDGELLVLEVNSGVMVEGYLRQHPDDYNLVKKIYHDAVARMLNA